MNINLFITKLLLLLLKISCRLYFSFPTAITLNNGNIFVIHKMGIDLCNPLFTEIIKNIMNFPADEQISDENKLAQVSIEKFEDGYIVCIIINTIYIFEPSGIKKLYYRLTTNTNIPYFSLTAYKYENGYHYFLIGYISNYQLMLYYFKYDKSENKILEISNASFKDKYIDKEIDITYSGISCQILKYSSPKDIIICFYSVDYDVESKTLLSISHFYIDGSTTKAIYPFKHYNYNYGFNCIKSFSTPDHSKIIFCVYFQSEIPYCYIYQLLSINAFRKYSYI